MSRRLNTNSPCFSSIPATRNAAPVPSPNNLPPLTFHQVHGDHIRLSQERRVAKRVESFCKGITFSARPVRVNERVCVKFSDISNNWSGVIRFGFTVCDPAAQRHNLPKYACPDLTNKTGFWIKALNETYCERDNILFYYVTASGDVHFGINGEEKGVFISGCETRSPLWTIIDVYGNCTAIEFLDYRHQAMASTMSPPNTGAMHGSQASLASSVSMRPQQPVAQCQNMRAQIAGSQRSLASTVSTISSGVLRGSQQLNTDVDRIVPAFQNLHTISSSSSQASLVEGASAMLPNIRHMPYGPLSQLTPMPLHRTKGRNVFISHNGRVASRSDNEFCQGYVFTGRPLRIGETIIVQILRKDNVYIGGLALGLTSCDPAHLSPQDLPDDSDQLLDRPEYWVVSKDVAAAPNTGDEIAICVTPTGEVTIRKNGGAPTTVMHVDQSLELYAFLDIYGSTQSVSVLSQSPLAHNTMSNSVSSQYLAADQNSQNGAIVPAPQRMLVQQQQQQLQMELPVAACYSAPIVTVQPSQLAQQQIQRNVAAANASNRQMAILMVNLPPANTLPAPQQQQHQQQQHPQQIPVVAASSSQQLMLSPKKPQQLPLSPAASCASSLAAPSPSYPQLSECTICYENSIDSVLYTCGHMCMCYECAIQQWRGIGGGHCPLCRAVIQDVIRTYKS